MFLKVANTFLLLGCLCACTTSEPYQKKSEGVVVGGIVANDTDRHDEKIEQRQKMLEKQEEKLSRQERELLELKRQQYHDQQLRKYEGGESKDFTGF